MLTVFCTIAHGTLQELHSLMHKLISADLMALIPTPFQKSVVLAHVDLSIRLTQANRMLAGLW